MTAANARIGVLSIGSLATIGLRPLPLVQLHLGRVFSLFGNAALQWTVPDGSLSELYEVGIRDIAGKIGP